MKKHENLILILLVVAIAAFPLIWKAGAEFGGVQPVSTVVLMGCDILYHGDASFFMIASIIEANAPKRNGENGFSP